MTSFLGHCYASRADEQVHLVAAVFCADRNDYEALVAAALSAQGYQFYWAEDVLPALPWVRRYPAAGGAALARSVNEEQRVALGPMTVQADSGDATAKDQSRLQIEALGPITPLDTQFGVYPKKNVPDALREALFGQPNPTEAERAEFGDDTPPLATYAVLDAAKMPYLLTSLLESSGLQYQSLFQGEAQDELAEHAPYLVELTEDSDFTRRLFTGPDGLCGLWEKELGIFLRSRAGFEAVRKHLRKFTKVQDENGKWFYFRFWDEVRHVEIVQDTDWLSRLLSHPTHALIVQSGEMTHRITSVETSPAQNGPLILTAKWKQSIAFAHNAQYARGVLMQEYRDLNRTLTTPLRNEWSRAMAQALHDYRLQRSWSRDCYISLSLTLGSHFDQDITLPGVQDLLQKDSPCYARMMELEEEVTKAIMQVCGEEYEHYSQALERFAALDTEQVERIVARENPLDEILRFFPRKAQVLSQERLSILAHRCKAAAGRLFQPMSGARGLWCFLRMCFC